MDATLRKIQDQLHVNHGQYVRSTPIRRKELREFRIVDLDDDTSTLLNTSSFSPVQNQLWYKNVHFAPEGWPNFMIHGDNRNFKQYRHPDIWLPPHNFVVET